MNKYQFTLCIQLLSLISKRKRSFPAPSHWLKPTCILEDGFLLMLLLATFYAFTSPVIAADETAVSMDYTMMKLATEFNDAKAQYLIGRKYLVGNGVKEDKAQAAQWFNKAALQNHVKAKYELGKMNLYGDGIPANYMIAYNLLSSAAGQHHTEAQFELANYYFDARYGEKNTEKALHYYTLAAQGNLVKAQYTLGKILYEGKDVSIEEDEGKKWLQRAAENGYPDATKFFAQIEKTSKPAFKTSMAKTSGDKPDVHTKEHRVADAYPRKNSMDKIDTGNVDAQYALGMAYLSGNGKPKDPILAATWLRKAAKQNHAGAQYQLGIIYRDGIGIAKSDSEAMKWFRLASSWGVTNAQRELDALLRKDVVASGEFNNNKELTKPDAQYTLGMMYAKGKGVEKDPATAAQWFLKAARQDHHEAQFQLGEMYNSGNGVDIDRKEAKLWLSKAANGGLDKASKVLKEILNVEKQRIIEQELVVLNTSDLYMDIDQAKSGDKDAQYRLALMYLEGDRVKKDIDKGIHWLQMAAEDDHTSAQVKLGEIYSNGLIVPQSFSSAAKWYKRAADSGNADAQYHLGNFYRKGTGVIRNEAKAIRLYRVAANKGHEMAKLRLQELR